ncbi:MAG: GNAT family N-acetyltransferase [Anaerolineales bacterium]|nr:GNAT family N-acetyltransferase [Anaerolineales bacterium]
MPAPVLYRPAAAADQAAITALIREAGINRMSLKWPNFLLAVDAVSGAVVATGQIKTHGDGSRELASIATRPAYQRRGIAGEIIRRLIAQDAAVSAAPLYLTCVSAMGPFYAPFGFRAVGPAEMPPYFRRLQRLVRVMYFFARPDGQLLVMRRDQAAPPPVTAPPPSPR